jgi:hypothetical protein
MSEIPIVDVQYPQFPSMLKSDQNSFHKPAPLIDSLRADLLSFRINLCTMVKMQFSLARWSLLSLAVAIAGNLFAQAPAEYLQEEFRYEMVQEDGNNGSAVAWNGQAKVYVAVIAGNESFPMEIFDAQGKAIAQSQAGWDWRGLWYNPLAGGFEGNAAGEGGWATFTLDREYLFSTIRTLREGQYQPDFQSVGAFDVKKNQVVFLDYSVDGLAMYSHKNPKKVKQLRLDFATSDLGNINSTTVGYTDHANYEFVLLDYSLGKLVFFNRSGDETASAMLPDGAPLPDMFAFSFTNDRAFLYDKEARVWHAYKVW